MKDVDGYTLIDYIKSAIEVLMNMKVEEQDEMENPDLFTKTSQELIPLNRHEMSQRLPEKRHKGGMQGHIIDDQEINIQIQGFDKQRDGRNQTNQNA